MKKINWKVRFKNGKWVLSFASLIVAFVYQLLGMFDVVPAVSQETIVQLIGLVLTVLAGVGIVQDPTTVGVGDSRRALGYDEPSAGEVE